MMFGLESFTFAAPWALVAFLLLPLLWQLLKTTPPKPQRIYFPAVRLLQELKSEQFLATKTPWWILLLRSLIIVCLILAMAQPIRHQNSTSLGDARHLVMFIDNDWSVMDRWQDRLDEMDKLLQKAEQQEMDVLLVPTADDVPLQVQSARKARASAAILRPRPWSTQRQKRLDDMTRVLDVLEGNIHFVWISNTLRDDSVDNGIWNHLAALGTITYISDGSATLPPVIQNVIRQNDALHVQIMTQNPTGNLQILDDQSHVLISRSLTKETKNELEIALPAELKSQSVALRFQGFSSPASQYLLDERWRDRPVGIIKENATTNSLLDPTYYIRKSLQPYAPLRTETLGTLLAREVSLIIDTGHTDFSADEQNRLIAWMNEGGVLIRFASDGLSRKSQALNSALLPVKLTHNERIIGGTLSWKRPAHLATFPDTSPFNNLEVSKDITVTRQVLAQPEGSLNQKTWARLQDGTPLITADAREKGWIVLFHVTASPQWSNLPLSGTFEQMMARLLVLSDGVMGDLSQDSLAPFRLFDGFGSLVPPYGGSQPISPKKLAAQLSDRETPPGLYGTPDAIRALNLGRSIKAMPLIEDIPLGVAQRSFDVSSEVSLAPWMLLGALLLALTDWVLSLGLRQRQNVMAALFMMLIASTVQAQTSEPDWEKALAAANHTRLAYMLSGDEKLDQDSRQGLDGLGAILRRRTAVELAPAMAFDPEKDDPSLFPMIYWPIGDRQQLLSDTAIENLNRFLSNGGFLLIDTMGQQRSQRLRKMTENLNIGTLQMVGPSHVLTRSFYLLDRFPGRYDNPDVWVEAQADQNRDQVSSVLIGSNSWAQAWARDSALRPVYAVLPGGEIQREQAFRFGVNLVMYILSGNYKGDQVHLPAILQRLGL